MKQLDNGREIVASGARVYLRPVEASDVNDAYLRWMNDHEVTRCLESRFIEHTKESLGQFVRSMAQSESNVFLAIVLINGQRHIGNLKIGPIDRHHGTADLGIIIGEKDCWGKGLATEAIALATTYAFSELRLRKITAGSYANNMGSVKAFMKAGWEIEGTLRRQYISSGEPVDKIVLAAFPDRQGI